MTKELLDLHVDKLKNFVANIFLKLVCLSHTGIHALNREIAATIQVQLGIRVRVQLWVGILG